MVEEKFEKAVAFFGMKKLIDASSAVIVGFSGGKDSCCLLSLLNGYLKDDASKLVACHLNHMIRGKEADRDEQYCRDFCNDKGIEFISKKINVPEIAEKEGLGLEEAARNARYGFFNEVAGELTGSRGGTSLIATAHTANDNMETVLFNIIRGTGISGLRGIPPVRDGKYIRPLIYAGSDETEDYCRRKGIEFITDSTNSDVSYTRNFIREKMIPEAETINPRCVEAVTRLSGQAEIDDECLDTMADSVLDEDGSVDRKKYMELDPAIKFRSLKKMFYRLKKSNDLQYKNLMDLSDFIGSGSNGMISLPDSVTAIIEKKIYMTSDDANQEKYSFDEEITGGTFRSDRYGYILNVSDRIPEDNGSVLEVCAAIDFDHIKGKLRVRSRREGDILRYGGHDRKVKKLFADSKISTYKRNIYPVVCDDIGIVWIPGFQPREGLSDKGDGTGNIKYIVYTEGAL